MAEIHISTQLVFNHVGIEFVFSEVTFLSDPVSPVTRLNRFLQSNWNSLKVNLMTATPSQFQRRHCDTL